MQKYLRVPFYFQAHFMPLEFKISLQLPVIDVLGVFLFRSGLVSAVFRVSMRQTRLNKQAKENSCS